MKKIFISLLLTANALYGLTAIHIHTDAADYRAGERMWFRTYFLDSDLLPDTAIQMAVVELIEPAGVVSQRVKVMRMDDIFSGYIDIPTHAEAGQYLVRAYARGMESHIEEEAGTQIVYIHGRINSANRWDSIVPVGAVRDSITAQRVAMPVSIRETSGIHEITIDTTFLHPGERVLISASVTDRYALSRHQQWTIEQSVSRMRGSTFFLSDEGGIAIRGTVETPVRRKPVKDEKCYIRGAHSIFGNNPAAIAINGVIQDGDYDLDLVSMQDIARLDIFKSGTTVIWGARGGAGVISIILKDGSEVPRQADPSNMKRLKPLGWQQPAEFFVQIPSDNSRRPGTLLWNPNVQSSVLHFTGSGAMTIYDVIIEGVTSHGRLIHEHQEIQPWS